MKFPQHFNMCIHDIMTKTRANPVSHWKLVSGNISLFRCQVTRSQFTYLLSFNLLASDFMIVKFARPTHNSTINAALKDSVLYTISNTQLRTLLDHYFTNPKNFFDQDRLVAKAGRTIFPKIKAYSTPRPNPLPPQHQRARPNHE